MIEQLKVTESGWKCCEWNIVRGIQSRRENSQPEILRFELKHYKINHGHIEYFIDTYK